MTALEQRAARALQCGPKLGFDAHRKFAVAVYAQSLHDSGSFLAVERAKYLWLLVWRYRRQIDELDLVAYADSVLHPRGVTPLLNFSSSTVQRPVDTDTPSWRQPARVSNVVQKDGR